MILGVSGANLYRTTRDLASQNRFGNNNMLRKIATHDKNLISYEDQVFQHLRNISEKPRKNSHVSYRENSRKMVRRQLNRIRKVRKKELLRNLWLYGHVRHLRKSS